MKEYTDFMGTWLHGLTPIEHIIDRIDRSFATKPKAIIPDPSWKVKKCKSCKRCGDYCNPYSYNGRILTRYSKPTYNACKHYEKR